VSCTASRYMLIYCRRMAEKIRDEYDALMICREKVMQRGLPMLIVDSEYQW
jgi:cell fate regulator YaaT (PSP1 superfamily)